MAKWNETLKRNAKYYQGQLTEKHFQHPEKILNSPKIITYRSSYERTFALWADSSPNVKKWGSELFPISYYNPIKSKQSFYYPDFIVGLMDGKVWIIEVKPSKQLIRPEARKWKQIQTWTINKAKFQAAEKFCAEKGYEFKILTEKELIPKKSKSN